MRKMMTLAALAAVMVPASASAVTYDVFDAFDLSDGVTDTANFRFGYVAQSSFAGTLSALTNIQTACGGNVNFSCAQTTFTDSLGVGKGNTPTGAYDIPGSNYISAGKLITHPSSGGLSAGIQFVATSAGVHNFAADFSSGDVSPGQKNVAIFNGTTSIYTGVFTSQPIFQNFSLTLGVGDTVTFLIGPGNDAYFNDTNNFGLTVSGPGGVPEPASWAMLIGGFGMAGAAMRRRARLRLA